MKRVYQVIILGALWGTFEATVGYVLHLSGLRIGSMIWFPVAYFFIDQAYRRTGSVVGTLSVALIAASLKLLDLFLPGRMDLVVNPAVSILLEALAVVAVYQYVLGGRLEKINPLTIALTGFLWRGMYVWYILSMPESFVPSAPYPTTAAFMEFMFVKNGINIALISVGAWVGQRVKWPLIKAKSRGRSMEPLLALGSVALAVAAQVFLG